MIIAKVYDSHHKAANWMRYYCEFNSGSVEKVTYKDRTVHLVTGDVILFRAVESMDDVMKQFGGLCVQWLELDSGSAFDYEMESWLRSRVRVPSNYITEKT